MEKSRKFRILQSVALAAALVGGTVVSMLADAHNGRHHHRARVGVYVGPSVLMSPFWYPPYRYYPAYPYPAPTIVVRPAAPVIYIEQADTLAPQAQPPEQAAQAYWHYCSDSQTYYPYVKTCASAWQRVIPHPPAPN